MNDAEREEGCAGLAAGWRRSDAERAAGDKCNVARWVPVCPVRMSIGCVGGGRMPGMTPEPALWSRWDGMVDNRRNVRGLLFEHVDIHGKPVDRLGQHAKRASPLGNMHVYSSSS